MTKNKESKVDNKIYSINLYIRYSTFELYSKLKVGTKFFFIHHYK